MILAGGESYTVEGWLFLPYHSRGDFIWLTDTTECNDVAYGKSQLLVRVKS